MFSKCHTIAAGLLLGVATIGCADAPSVAPVNQAENVEQAASGTQERRDAPFEYKLVSKEEMMHSRGPQVVISLETTNEVARNATKDDLRKLWEHLEPTVGERRAFVYVSTPVPGAGPWGVISRISRDSEWELDVIISEFAIDAEPYHFVDQIDRSVENQRAMIVTLPVVNGVNENLVRDGWAVERRTENHYSARKESRSVTLTPEAVHVQVFKGEGNTFPDTVAIVFAELGIEDKLKDKLHSVIGSPEYLRGESPRWIWNFGEIQVIYSRVPGMDDVYAVFSHPE